MIKLYHHQEIALSFMRMQKSFALFMEGGTGKTLVVLTRILELFKQDKIKNALIVCPKAVIGAWERDMEILGNPLEFEQVTVINYDMIWRREQYNKHWDVIILDESHFIKRHARKRSKFILGLALNSTYRYIMTGTAVGNGKLEDVWSQFAFLFPVKALRSIASKHFGTYYEFSNKHCVLNKYYQPYKYLHIDEIQTVLNTFSYHVTKEECLDLPEKLPDEIYDIELQEKAMYKKLVKDKAIADLDLVVENPAHLMTVLREICSGFCVNNGDKSELKCEKIRTLDEFLEGHDKKLVIFAHFKYSILQIEQLMTKKKIKFVTLDGRTKDKNIWRDFQKNDKIQVIICQYQTASQGIDLFSADTIIYYEPTLSSTLLEQSKDRIYRIGQTKKCRYIHFITKGTLERNIYISLQKHIDFNQNLFIEVMEDYQKGFGF